MDQIDGFEVYDFSAPLEDGSTLNHPVYHVGEAQRS